MKKHLLVWALCAGLFFVGCSDDGNEPDPKPNPPEPPALSIDDIIKLPYSSLKPDEQKVKLENEGTAFIDMANALKTSTSVEAYQALGELLNIAQPTLVANKKAATIEETVQYADVYGIHTWDATKKQWTKTASTSELKFIFPSKKNGTTNNAEFSVNAVSSGIPVVVKNTEDNGYYDKDWNWVSNETTTETTYYLPSSAKGSLKVGGAEVGTINLTAEYKDKKEVPVKMEFVTKLSDGYELGASFNKAAENKVVSYLKYNDNVMFYAEASATAKLDEIFENIKDDTDPAYAAYGKVNGHFKLLNNLVIVVTGDAAKYAEEMDAVSAKYNQKRNAYYAKINALGDYRKYKDYYTEPNQIEKSETEERVIIINKYIKPILAATNEDAAKIAQLEMKLVIDDYTANYDEYWDNTAQEWKNCSQYVWNEEKQKHEWVKVAEPDPNAKFEYYEMVPYLRFKDNTLVEADTYFSAGFSKFTEKWDAFVKAFDRE